MFQYMVITKGCLKLIVKVSVDCLGLSAAQKIFTTRLGPVVKIEEKCF